MNETFQKAVLLTMTDKIEYSDGGVISKQVLKNDAGNITLFSFDRGQGLSEHTAPFDAFIQVIDGEAEIKIACDSFLVRAGESIIMPANIPHSVFAVNRFKMLLTMIRG